MAIKPQTGQRIAKLLARAGIASRRDAEKMVLAGKVSVNGRIISSPALNVLPDDLIEVDGRTVPAAAPPRLWRLYKSVGSVTTARDEQGRRTVFDELPKNMPRTMTVGRLDLNSEGLLLLTNSGEVKRLLELPQSAWLRTYRVRVLGQPGDREINTLRSGLEADGVDLGPFEVELDRQKGANAWLTVGLRRGRNREIRRAMQAVGLRVNRLIRISFGPFALGDLKPSQVAEVTERGLLAQAGISRKDEWKKQERRMQKRRDDRPQQKFQGKGQRKARPCNRKK